jgi:cytidylate kinase
MPLIVAIDGPAGVGKSTTSKRVARVLGIPHIDTGAMYRAVALKALRAGADLADAARLEQITADSSIEFFTQDSELRTRLDGEDVTEAIRAPEVSMAASTVSAISSVRRLLVAKQQELGRRTGGVLEGRDIGTKVFPETPHKFFLTARPEVRARRRLLDLQAKGISESFEKVLGEVLQRDRQDTTRADSPLKSDETYQAIDTSDMTLDEVVERIVSRIHTSTSHAS